MCDCEKQKIEGGRQIMERERETEEDRCRGVTRLRPTLTQAALQQDELIPSRSRSLSNMCLWRTTARHTKDVWTLNYMALILSMYLFMFNVGNATVYVNRSKTIYQKHGAAFKKYEWI